MSESTKPTAKPTVRLEKGVSAEMARKKSAESKPDNIKLAIRLAEGINDALRTLIRYRGDLSNMALEALNSVDLETAALVSVDEDLVADTTVTMPRTLHKKMKKVATERGTSMNILANTALAHWLAAAGRLTLK